MVSQHLNWKDLLQKDGPVSLYNTGIRTGITYNDQIKDRYVQSVFENRGTFTLESKKVNQGNSGYFMASSMLGKNSLRLVKLLQLNW
jgi:hypothetical protein